MIGVATRAISVTLTIAAAPVIGTAQPGEPRPSPTFVHESWTVRDGLPVNSVNAVLQSRDGYIWVATFDGLARFDGVRFTVFNSATSPGLPSNRIVSLQETRDGHLWLRTEDNQLVRFAGGRFTAFGRERGIAAGVTALFEDTSGTVWIGSEGGLGVIRGDRFVRVAPEVIDGPVRAITQRADGSIWVGVAGRGLFRIARDRASAVAGQPAALVRGDIRALEEDLSGSLWVGLNPDGIWRFDDHPEWVVRAASVLRLKRLPRSGEVWAATPDMVYRLESGRATAMQRRVGSHYHTDVLVPDDAGAMLYTSGPKLYRDGRLIHTLPVDSIIQPDIPSSITGIARDHEGSIWLGTWGAGLHRLKPAAFHMIGAAEGLSADNVYSVYEDAGGTIWVGTLNGGTNRIERGRVSRVPNAVVRSTTALSFLQDRTGRFWIGGDSGIVMCSAPGIQCARPPFAPMPAVRVRAIYEEPTGALWFGTEGGLFRLEHGRWEQLRPPAVEWRDVVRAFAGTRDGALWMATTGAGLLRYKNGRFRPVTTADGLPFDRVRSLHTDRDGWLWVGTEGRGLARLESREWEEGKQGGRIVSVRAPDGLFDEVIHAILADDADRLWMSSNRGIFWVDRRELLDFADGRRTSINSTGYTERDGLRNREANGGSQPAATRSRDGRLWFATQGGVAVVDPARVQRNRIPPNVVVEQVISASGALAADAGPIRLGTTQRDLEIRYTALSFLAPANVRFRYRLEPYDAAWVEAGSRRTAFYTKVPPGHYTFRVRASNNDGVWNEQGASLDLELAPEVWETQAFRFAALLTAGLLVAAAVGWRMRLLRVRTQELGRLVDERTQELSAHKRQLEGQTEQLKELDRAKTRFFANVSHELRTPLTLTIGPLEDLRAELQDRARLDPPRQLEMALRNSRRLLRLVNQILDVAKLEAGQMKLRARCRDLVSFARGVAAAFTPVAEQKQIEFAVTSEPSEVLVWFDADAMEKVLANLLSNAFKFTPAGGRIALYVETRETSVLLRVTDTGPGIAPEHLPHVFERFYQVDESTTRAQPGTGIGLALVKELAELHGGSVGADSTVGATFTITLPLGRAHLRDDQIVAVTDEIAIPSSGSPVGGPTVVIDEEVAAVTGERGVDVATLLVVDDSADMRTYVREHFASRYRVVEAVDGAEGIERAREVVPDLVISDVMMPRMDGNALCRTLKGDPETDFIPIILLTARASTDDRVVGFIGGADDYLAKPFEMRELEARVENLIASRRRLRERFAGAPAELPPTPPHPGLSRDDQSFVDRLHATIATHFAEPEFSVAELARQLFVDRSHLFRRTRELLGEAPSDLIRRARLARAAALLAEGAGTVAEVAYGVGFQSVSHFSQAFREVYGVSPSGYRDSVSARS